MDILKKDEFVVELNTNIMNKRRYKVLFSEVIGEGRSEDYEDKSLESKQLWFYGYSDIIAEYLETNNMQFVFFVAEESNWHYLFSCDKKEPLEIIRSEFINVGKSTLTQYACWDNDDDYDIEWTLVIEQSF
ncbi:MAG: hypothetical protein WBP58_17745 [Chitinophagaceae bacterium]